MKFPKIYTTFFFGGLCTLALALPSLERGDSGISGPSYATIVNELDSLTVEYASLANVVEYGRSVKNRPLKMLVVKKKGIFSQRPTLLMTGTTHGNEYLNLEDRLPRALLERSKTPGPVAHFLNNGGAFVFVPIVNPDGYESRTRSNANGTDLNRDWDVSLAGYAGFKERETRALREKLDALTEVPDPLTYKITVDYHCCIGALLYPWSYTRSPLAEIPLAQHKAVGQLAKQDLAIDSGTTAEILGYQPVGTTKDYYFERYGALAFTYEGRYQEESRYFERHIQWWENLAQFINGRTATRLVDWIGVRKFPFLRLAD